jgi:hypothetical protein
MATDSGILSRRMCRSILVFYHGTFFDRSWHSTTRHWLVDLGTLPLHILWSIFGPLRCRGAPGPPRSDLARKPAQAPRKVSPETYYKARIVKTENFGLIKVLTAKANFVYKTKMDANRWSNEYGHRVCCAGSALARINARTVCTRI